MIEHEPPRPALGYLGPNDFGRAARWRATSAQDEGPNHPRGSLQAARIEYNPPLPTLINTTTAKTFTVHLIGVNPVEIATYGIEKEQLSGLLGEAGDGKTQLPDFQRGWVWDDDHIKSLLASISLGYPIGAVMMLRAGGEAIRFRQRPLEGAPPARQDAERLILDGQQRLTSLFQSLRLGEPVRTRDQRGREIERWYYIDMRQALDKNVDREEAVISLPADRKVKRFGRDVIEDYSTPEREYGAMLFPLIQVFDTGDWMMGFQEHWEYDPEKSRFWIAFHRSIVKRFEQYQVPVIELGRDTPKEAVCQVFEKVNTGGVTLTVFELLTATFAVDDFDLRSDWDERGRTIHS